MAKLIKARAFDVKKYGSIETEPPRIFPADETAFTSGSRVPHAALTDPLAAGEAALDFLCSGFKFTEGRFAGEEITRDKLAPWQLETIKAIFGHRDPKTWTRYFDRAFIVVPRKNAKTWLAATVSLIAMFSTQEQNGQILSVANSQAQARRPYDLLIGMLKTQPKRFSTFRVQDSRSIITNNDTGVEFRALQSADPGRLHGMSPSMLIADEMWAWTGQKGQRIWDGVTTGMGARRNPLTIAISSMPDHATAATDIFNVQMRSAQQVLDGEIDDRRLLPMLWLTDTEADISDPDVMRAANPGVDYSLSIDELISSHEKAANNGDAAVSAFATLRLGQLAKSAFDDAWLAPATIEKFMGPEITMDDLRDCHSLAISLDIGGGHDVESIVITGLRGDEMLVKQLGFVSKDGAEAIRAGGEPIDELIRLGQIVVSGETGVPIETVVAELVDIANFLDLQTVIVDITATSFLISPLEKAGLEVIGGRQGTMSMTPAIRYVEDFIARNKVDFGDGAAMAWFARNVAMQSSTMGRKPIKVGSDDTRNPRKIDGVSAWLTGVQLLLDGESGLDKLTGDDKSGTPVDPWRYPQDAVDVSDGYIAMFNGPERQDHGCFILY